MSDEAIGGDIDEVYGDQIGISDLTHDASLMGISGRPSLGKFFGLAPGAEDEEISTEIPQPGMSPVRQKPQRKVYTTIDRRTQLSFETMRSRIDDVSDTLRELKIAPTNLHQLEIKELEVKGTDDLFSRSFDDDLPSNLQNLISMNTRKKIELPEIEEVSEEEHGRFEEEQGVLIGEEEEGLKQDQEIQEIPEEEEKSRIDEQREELFKPQEQPIDKIQTHVSVSDEDERISESVSERTSKMRSYLNSSFSGDEGLSFKTLFQGKPRRTVSVAFFELLVLKSKSFIDLQQEEPYGDIVISKTPSFARATA